MAKKNEFSPQILAAGLAEICARSLIAEGRELFWTIIANPKAGGFTIKTRAKKHYSQLTQCVSAAVSNPAQIRRSPSKTASRNKYGLILTNGKGHAEKITEALIKEAAGSNEAAGSKEAAGTPGEANKNPKPLFLIITAGGDGTSLDVLSTILKAPAEIRSCFAVLRLPMGTGNDGADAFELDQALRLIIEPSEIFYRRSLRLVTSTPEKGPYPAFNILSVGLDAFVTHMTNKMKGKLPGDFYKLWVDIASLFYDRIYKVGPMEVRACDDSNAEVKKFKDTMLLLAMGESGHRSYGSHNFILPDDRNVCAVKQMPLMRKIAFKNLVAASEHVTQPESILFNASRVEITCENPILAQMDGETVLLQKNDFPVAIELTEPVIPVLRLIKN
ncbi:MAG: diacylglycerol kinase [Treponema sp.]|nr:diacylglycerol kinase [Treponema sp.]